MLDRMSMPPRDVAEAGVVLRDDTPGSPRYLVIQRPDDWSLPKGHWKDGETLEQTAVRELAEETGCRATIDGPAGVFTYETDGQRRSVHFFHAIYAGTELPPRALDGVVQVRWLPRDQAAAQLTYDDLREFFVAATSDGSAKQGGDPIDLGSAPSVRLDRLATAIDLFRQELPGIRARSPAPEQDATAWRSAADRLVLLAETYARSRRVDAAWEALHSAQRLTINDLTAEEIQSRAAARHSEVASKLTGWRRDAAMNLLTEKTVTAPSLVEATRLLDEQSANVYLKLRLTRVAVPLAAGLLVLILALLVLAVQFGWFAGLRDTAEPFVLTDLGLLGGTMVLGAFGAMLSLALDRQSDAQARKRIWQLVSVQFTVPVARLAIGAASGVVVVAATQSSIAEAGQAWAVLTAIPAGFSERLVRRSVEALDVSGAESRRADA